MNRHCPVICLVLLWYANVLCAGPPQPTFTPLVRVVDLDISESQSVELCDESTATVKLLGVEEIRDSVRSAIRVARVTVEVNGQPTTLSAGNYHLPVTFAGVQIDCTVTKGYLLRANADRWGLVKDARLRLWPTGSPLVRPGTLLYPVKQRWFAELTWMGNEVVDAGGEIRPEIYYHSGLDFGGAPRMVEVVAAADGLVVARGKDILPGYEGTPVYRLKPRDDVVYVFDARGWSYRYSHLYSIDPGVRKGQAIRKGQKIGVLGHKSGGWSHLHFEIKCIQPSGKWGTQAGYALAWEAYCRQYSPELVAVARPHRLAWPGEIVVLDGSRSWTAKGEITDYEWIFDDGSTASGAKLERKYDRPGSYCEILKITNSDGKTDYDFAYTMVVDRATPTQFPPYTCPAYFPTFDVKPGDAVTFKVRSFNVTDGRETWDFGDGSPPTHTRSGDKVSVRDEDGYATVVHRYSKPGHYLVRVERSDEQGRMAMARLHVRVD